MAGQWQGKAGQDLAGLRPDFQPATELLKGGMCQKRAQTQSVGFAGRLRIQRTLRKADTQLALMAQVQDQMPVRDAGAEPERLVTGGVGGVVEQVDQCRAEAGIKRRQRRAAKSERGQFGISCMGSHIRNNSNP